MTGKVVMHPAAADLDPIRVSAQLLVSQLGRLQRRLREGVEPPYGELTELFETRDFLEKQLRTPASSPMFEKCPMDDCPNPALVTVNNGRRLCPGHAAELQKLMGVRP
jgi:hypothetical protein